MIRQTCAFGLTVAFLLASGVFVLKDRVQRLEAELRRTERQIDAERTHARRLRAEWALLSEPGRISRLAGDYLNLSPAHPGHIIDLDELPMRSAIEVGQRSWPAPLPSGAETTLRLKPKITPRLATLLDLKPVRDPLALELRQP